jgi:putative phosphoribosyl transferase
VRFSDRTDAGQRLAKRLGHLRGEDVVVLGLPRGGVPVAFEVARELGAPLDVIMVRKLGLPNQPELAMGAIGEGGVRVSNDDVVHRSSVTELEIAFVEERERHELHQQAKRLRPGGKDTDEESTASKDADSTGTDNKGVDLTGRTAIVIDDGIATGSTAAVACEVARRRGAAKVVLAVPVGAPESIEALRDICDEVVCLLTPPFFMAVGSWYDDFSSVPDAQVTAILRQACGSHAE